MLSDDAYIYGNHSGVNSQGLTPYAGFRLEASPAGENTDFRYWSLEAERLGLDTARFELESGNQGIQRFRLQYRAVPRFQFDDAQTPLRNTGASGLILPQDWQAVDATTGGMTTLQQNLTDINLWRNRQSLGLDYRRYLGEDWVLNTDFRREKVTGRRALGGVTGATGGNARAVLLPDILDRETYIAGLALGYSRDRVSWNLGYQGSFFRNGHDALQWPTPFGQHPQWAAGVGYPDGINQLALEPDNQAHQLRFNAGFRMAGSTRLHLDSVLGRQTQDQRLLPYSINPQIPLTAALPRDSLNARVDITRVNLRLNTRPAQRLNLVARLGYSDRNNRTDTEAWQRVRGDAVAQQDLSDARVNRPYGLSESSASLDLAYRLSRGARLESGYRFVRTDRDYSEVTQADEQTWKLGLRTSSLDSLALALNYVYQQRRTDDYVGNRPLIATHLPGSVDAEDFENHPLLRKYYLSERDRHQLQVQGDWYPLPRLTVGAALAWSRDEYPSGYLGLNDSDMISLNLNSSYSLDDGLQLSLFLNRDRYRTDQKGRSFRGTVPADVTNPDRDWRVEAADYFDTLGATLDWSNLQLNFNENLQGSLDLSLSLSYSAARGEIDTSAGPALQSFPLPDLRTRISSLSLSGRYRWSDRSALRLLLEHEHYQSRDFALDQIQPDTLSGVLLMGYSSPAYKVTHIGLSYEYSF